MKHSVTLDIDGMTCQMCVRHIVSALTAIEGAEVRSVDVGSAIVDVDPAVVPDAVLIDVVKEAGYEVRAVSR